MSKLNFLKILTTNKICALNLSSSTYRLSTDPLESRFVAKIFKKQQRKKKHGDQDLFDAPVTIPEGVLGKTKRQPQAKPVMSPENPRLIQTEKILHENISNIIQSGQIGVSVPITKVRLVPDFSQLNIYWEATGDSKKDKKIQNTLNSRTKPLRYLLSTAQESRYVPTISFLKDLSYVREQELEAYFKDLDTGKTQEVGKTQELGKTQESGKTQDNDEHANMAVVEKLPDDHDSEHDIKWVYNQNVFDVPHDLLMKKVMNSKLKSRNDDLEKMNDCESENESRIVPFKKVSFDKSELGFSKKKKIQAKRREDVKHISRLLGGHSKSGYLKGNLTHIIPDVLEESKRENELNDKLQEFKRQGLPYFESGKYKDDETASIEDIERDSADFGRDGH